MYSISNSKLIVTVSPMGAELQSIKNRRRHEYLWQGDSRIWGRRSPILFPIVGSLWHGKYHIGDNEYQLSRHGFARDMEFQLVEKTSSSLVFELTDTPETMESYPYRFGLRVGYKLQGNTVHVVWEVHNRDSRRIYFSIGGHPAFRLPGYKKGEPVVGRLQLEPTSQSQSLWWLEKAEIGQGGCLREERNPLDTDSQMVLHFAEETFKDDAIVVDRSQLRSISILTAAGKPVVKVDFQTPAVGIWKPYGKQAPFVCIEPWYGVADSVGYEGQLKEKYLINALQPGGTFKGGYDMTFY